MRTFVKNDRTSKLVVCLIERESRVILPRGKFDTIPKNYKVLCEAFW